MQAHWLLGGGIGSGKSRVRSRLDELGVPTLDADSLGHSVLDLGGPAYEEVAAHWPGVVTNGIIDRQALGQNVFASREQLALLESLTHPHIRTAIEVSAADNDLLVVEMPILDPRMDSRWRRIVVDCSERDRVERAVARGMAESDVIARMAAQPSRSQWLAVADLVVPNHGSLEELDDAAATLSTVLCD